ncbi:MAG: hypothetical protein IIX15_01975 [Clostridia bacterium]|nr:hypothetical protein [Clostridia bacterium]
MMERHDDDMKLLCARVDELCDRAVRGRFVHTDFLTPRQGKHAMEQLRRRGEAHRARLHGGYASAERCCLLLFPDYVMDAYTDGAEPPITAELLAMAGEDDPIAAISVRGSGYRTLCHRDYLGSLLSLGLEREVLGDIALEGNDATVLCMARMLSFLLENAHRIGGDSVRVSQTILPPDFDGGRKFAPLQDTVASARLDCVVAALCNLSREAAQTAVRDGLVELDYECELRPDRTLEPPCIISVRGMGKFILRELGTLTKKGRIRMRADRCL